MNDAGEDVVRANAQRWPMACCYNGVRLHVQMSYKLGAMGKAEGRERDRPLERLEGRKSHLQNSRKHRNDQFRTPGHGRRNLPAGNGDRWVAFLSSNLALSEAS